MSFSRVLRQFTRTLAANAVDYVARRISIFPAPFGAPPINHTISLPTPPYASNYDADDHADSNAQTTRSNGVDRAELPLNDGHRTRNTRRSQRSKRSGSQIHNSSYPLTETKSSRVGAREDTLEAPGRHRPAPTFADESYGLPKCTSD